MQSFHEILIFFTGNILTGWESTYVIISASLIAEV